jgi:CRISPR/Cas system-associated exonuclease Cas4 (RecB family)
MNAYGGVITQKDIDEIIAKIGKDTDYMKQFLEDQDAVKNIPLDPFVFRKTTTTKKCESCTFRDVCGKLK